MDFRQRKWRNLVACVNFKFPNSEYCQAVFPWPKAELDNNIFIETQFATHSGTDARAWRMSGKDLRLCFCHHVSELQLAILVKPKSPASNPRDLDLSSCWLLPWDRNDAAVPIMCRTHGAVRSWGRVFAFTHSMSGLNNHLTISEKRFRIVLYHVMFSCLNSHN